MRKKILSIAGSDSSGGAGIQADIATITSLGGVAMSAVTAVTAQDENFVHAVEYISISVIRKQIEVVIGSADAIKIGMLGNSQILSVVSGFLSKATPIVLDPVIFSTSGYRLLSKDAIYFLKNKLCPEALLVTPNIPEAEELSGVKISSAQDMIVAGQKILKFGAKAVLVKGGHLIQINSESNSISDVLVLDNEQYLFTHDVIKIKTAHGTGCKLSSAIACCLAQGRGLRGSIKCSIKYVMDDLMNQ